MGKPLRPGNTVPKSGQYDQIGPRGGFIKEVTLVKHETVPPGPTKGITYQIADPTKNKSGR